MSVGSYKFLQIADAISSLNQRVNLVGVALESTTSETDDRFCAVRIIDESHSTGIHVHFFLETSKELPLVKNVGDILLVSNVLISRSPGYVYAMFNKSSSTFALFPESSTTDVPTPYQISAGYKISDEDIKSLVEIQKCSLADKLVGLKEIVSMSEIQDGNSFNMICKILHNSQLEEGNWVLFIWNGTDTPPLSINTRMEDEMGNPLPLALKRLERDVLCTFPCVGTVVMMTVDQEDKKLDVQLLKTNEWVNLINIRCQTKDALWSAVWTPHSRFYYLPEDHNNVIRYQRNYEERMQSKWLRKPITSSTLPSRITETGHPHIPLVTLMDILTYPEVVGKYRCIVRVVALLPCTPASFRAPNGVFRIRLTLEDPTARIHAYLYKEDGGKFFRGCRSEDLLTVMRNKLIGSNGEATGTRNPPWIDCCLKSFSTDETDRWGSRSYLMFDTWLV